MNPTRSRTTFTTHPPSSGRGGSPVDDLDFAPMDCCPSCGDTDFDVSSANGDLCFRCGSCAAHWRYELGHVRLPADASAPSPGCTFPA